MYRIVWTEKAISHIEAIVAYVSAFNPAAAERLGAGSQSTVTPALCRGPRMGLAVPLEGRATASDGRIRIAASGRGWGWIV